MRAPSSAAGGFRFVLGSLVVVAGLLWVSTARSAGGVADDEVERIIATIGLRKGDIVADIGAGQGQLTEALAQFVGPDGRVFATEVSQARLVEIRRRVDRAELSNVVVVEGASRATNLPPACCDALVLRDVYHHFREPGAMNVSMLSSLRPGGHLLVIDFPPRRWWPAPEGMSATRGGHGVALETVVEEVTAAGFDVVSRIERWSSRQYAVLARRPAGR